MTINIDVKNFCGIDRATIACDKVTLVAGLNSQGKTSLFNAVQLLLTAQPLPDRLPKSKGGTLVRSGASSGHAMITLPDTDAGGGPIKQSIKWPECVLDGDGVVLASDLATGRVRIAAMDSKERARVLTTALKAAPNEADFMLEMQDQGFEASVVSPIWANVIMNGWDVEWKARKEHGAVLKGRWEGVTGENFGSAKVKTWLPATWRDELAHASKDALEIALSDAKTDHEMVIAQSAVTMQEAETLKGLADTVPELTKDCAAAEVVVDKLSGRRVELLAQRERIGPVEQDDHICPHEGCNLPIRIINQAGASVLVRGETIEDSIIEANRKSSASLETDITDCAAETTEANRKLEGLKTRLREAKKAADQLTKTPDHGGEATADEVNTAREAVTVAESDLRSFTLWGQASAIGADFGSNQKVIDVLAPEGLRRAKLNRALDAFHTHYLDPICDAAKWARVKIEGDMSITYNGRSYPLARNEKWKISAAIQVSIGTIENAAMIILDDADALDMKGRNGLFTMLEKLKVPSLVCMQANKDKLPDLAASGWGSTYWIEGGNAEIFTGIKK